MSDRFMRFVGLPGKSFVPLIVGFGCNVPAIMGTRTLDNQREREREDNRSNRDASPEMSGMARGLRIGTEFIAAVLVGAGIGYLIDLGLGTSPWGLLIMLLVGFAAGILNVTRVVAKMNAASPAPPQSDPGPGAEDEADK